MAIPIPSGHTILIEAEHQPLAEPGTHQRPQVLVELLTRVSAS